MDVLFLHHGFRKLFSDFRMEDGMKHLPGSFARRQKDSMPQVAKLVKHKSNHFGFLRVYGRLVGGD